MLELFYGDSYLIAEELAKITLDYPRKMVIDEVAEINKVRVFSQENLFGEKALLVLRNLLAVINRQPDLWKELLLRSGNDQRVVFWEEEKLDYRLKIVKEIQNKEAIRHFKPLTPWQLRRWVLSRAKIEQPALEELLARAGKNLWLLKNELDKLSLFHSDGIIDQDSLRNLGSLTATESVFAWVDAVGNKDWINAAAHLEVLLSQEDHFRLFSLLVRQFRLLILLKSGVSLSEAGFVVEKVRNQARFWSLVELKDIYQELCELEFAVKEGNKDLVDELSLLLLRGQPVN